MVMWMAAIFAVSHRPAAALPSFGAWDLLGKKLAHFLAYAILALLVRRVTGEVAWPFWGVLVVTAVYAASDEFHQLFVPGRNGNLMDVIIDFLGSVAGLAVYRYWRQRRQHHRP